MKRRKRKDSSLEHELKRLAGERLAKDPQKRSRAALLASTLWNRSLAGDREGLKLLLDRLPVVDPLPETETTADKTEPRRDPYDYESITRAFKSLVEAGVIPVEAFAKFAYKDFEKENPNWESPEKMQ